MFAIRYLLKAINVIVFNNIKILNIVYINFLTKKFEKQRCYFIVIKFENLITIN